VEESLAIHCALNAQADGLALDLTAEPEHPLNQTNRQNRTAKILLKVASTYADLNMLDESQRAMQEALALYSRHHGSKSETVGIYLDDSRAADICNLQAIAIRTSLAQSSSSYWPGTRVRLEGLQNQARHKGLEGVVLKLANNSLVCVCLDQDNKDLRLKLQNVRLLVASADKRKEMYTSIRTLEDEEIASR